MVYTPPPCNAVDFYPKVLVIPPCNAVNFDLTEGGTVQTGITTLNSYLNIFNTAFLFTNASMIRTDDAYLSLFSDVLPVEVLVDIIAENSTVNIFSDSANLRVLPDMITHDSVIQMLSQTADFKPGDIFDLPTRLGNGGIKIPYGGNVCVDEYTEFNWEDTIKVDEFTAIKPQLFDNADKLTGDDWRVLDYIDNKTKLPIENSFNHWDHLVSFFWNTMMIADNLSSIRYGDKTEITQNMVIPYLQPGAVDVQKISEYDILHDTSLTFSFDWNAPGAADKHQLVPWGPLYLFPFCNIKYEPPTGGVVNFKLTSSMPVMNSGLSIEVNVDDAIHIVTFSSGNIITVLAEGTTYYIPYGGENGYNIIIGIGGSYDVVFQANNVTYQISFDVYGDYALNFNPDGTYDVIFDVDGRNTDPRCEFDHNYTGKRDPYISGIRFRNISSARSREVYYMFNTVFVQTLITHEPIHVLGLSATIDQQSWLWQFNLVIGSRSSLDLIAPEPVSGGALVYKDVEININGWKWTCRVESWTENRAFGKDAWNVVGRSPSMELGAPQNPVSDFTYNDIGGGSAGAQIMEEILKGTMQSRDDLGWRLDWSFFADKVTEVYGFDPSSGAMWGFPDGAYSWSGQTQIESILPLIESIGAYLQTVPDCSTDKKLKVMPKFHVPPWHWSFNSEYPQNLYKSEVAEGATYHIDHKINEAICKSIGRSFVSLPSYNAVYVMGQSSVPAVEGNIDPGVVFVNVYRDNGDALVYAPNHTDPWITSILSAGEAGRNIISNTGEWSHHTLDLFALASSGTEDEYKPGLILPGEYIQLTEKNKDIFGQVFSTSINVSMVNGSVCSVNQIIEMHEYLGTKTVG